MSSWPIGDFPSAALCLLLCGCDGELLVGETRCYGDGVDCSSDAPTLDPYGPDFTSGAFEVDATRSVMPVWMYDYPIDRLAAQGAQLAPAPDGTVWSLHMASATEHLLQRIDANGEPVESYALDTPGVLSADEELHPLVLSWRDGRVTRTTLGPPGERVTGTSGEVAPGLSPPFMASAPEGRIRVANFDRSRSYIATYRPPNELLWRQSELRDARDFPFEKEDLERPVEFSYAIATLSDGAIALGMPKRWPRGMSASPGTNGFAGLALNPERVQGITVIEPDGNMRWDMILGEASRFMLLAPGPAGSVVYASIPAAAQAAFYSPVGVFIRVIDRDGALTASWMGARTGYHDATPLAICSDAAGAVYATFLSAEHRAPVLTACRLSAREGDRSVDCVGVENVLREGDNTVVQRVTTPMIAPEPNAVVFPIVQSAGNDSITRLVRVEFEP